MNGQRSTVHGKRRAVRRVATITAAAIAAFLALLAVVMWAAPVVVSGARFGRLLERSLPRTRGAIHVGGGAWTWNGLWRLWRGQAAPFSLDDVRILDPEGTEVFRVRRLTGTVEIARNPVRIGLRNLRVTDGSWRFAVMRVQPGIGFLAALSPAGGSSVTPPSRESTPRATSDGVDRAKVPAGATLAIFDARLESVDVLFAFPDWELAFSKLSAAGQLAYDATPRARPAFTFGVDHADARGGGRLALALLLPPPARRELRFSRAWLNRVATTAAAPDVISLDASPVVVGRSQIAFNGTFTGVYDNGGPPAGVPGMNAQIRASDAADVVGAILASGDASIGGARAGARVLPSVTGGTGADLKLDISGPFQNLAMRGSARGFEAHHAGFDLIGVGAAFQAHPSEGKLSLTRLALGSPAGGRVVVDAEIAPAQATVTARFDRLALRPFLPGALHASAADGILDGVVRGRIHIGQRSATVDELALSLFPLDGRSRSSPIRLRASPRATGDGPPRYRASKGSLVLVPHVKVETWGGLVIGHGSISLGRDLLFDFSLQARGILLERLLGSSLATGRLSFDARARGSLQDLALRVRFMPGTALRVLGEEFRPPANVTWRVSPDGVVLPALLLRGPSDCELTVAGRLTMAGALDLVAGVRNYPLARLPGLADRDLPFAGRLSGELRLTGGGTAGALIPNGHLSIPEIAFDGRPLGSGFLAITPGRRGALRARGQVIEGVTIDGTLTPGPRGVSGDATLNLSQVHLEPFLDSVWKRLSVGLPQGLTASVVASGTARARVAAGQPSTLEARLAQLALVVTSRRDETARAAAPPGKPEARATVATRSVNLRSAGDVEIFVQEVTGVGGTGAAAVRLGLARFAGSAGSIELAANREGGEGHAVLRGRLSIAALAEMLPDVARGARLEGASGSVDFDLAGASTRADARLLVTGKIGIDAVARLRLARASASLKIAAGRIQLRPERSATIDIPIAVDGAAFRLTGGWSSAGDQVTHLAIDAGGDVDVQLLRQHLSPYVDDAAGRAAVAVHLGGTFERPRLRASVDVKGISFALPGARGRRVAIRAGQIDLDEESAVFRDLDVRVGELSHFLVGGTGTGGARVRFLQLRPLALTELDIPVTGDAAALSTSTTAVDSASFALRLQGRGLRALRLGGDVDVRSARVSSRPLNARAGHPTDPAPKWVSSPEVQGMALNLHVRSRPGAVTVDVPYAPDLHLGLDVHVSGILKNPTITGDVRGAGIYSSLGLSLYKFFKD